MQNNRYDRVYTARGSCAMGIRKDECDMIGAVCVEVAPVLSESARMVFETKDGRRILLLLDPR